MNLSAYEKETIITYNQQDKGAMIYTFDKALISKLLAYCEQYPKLYQLESRDEDSASFIIPKQYVSIRKPKILTDEAKKKLTANMQKVLADRRNKLPSKS